MAVLLILAAVVIFVWIFFFISTKDSSGSVHTSSFYWPDKNETEKHIERISYQSNANYINSLTQQIKGDKHGNK